MADAMLQIAAINAPIESDLAGLSRSHGNAIYHAILRPMQYPQLAPQLQSLTEFEQVLLGNPNARLGILADMMAKYISNDSGYQPVLTFVDTTIANCLGNLGFPRGPVRSVTLVDMPPTLSGLKRPTCDLVISSQFVIQQLIARAAEAVIETWVHESIHARQPFVIGFAQETDSYTGYEEGMAEGLTRIICERYAGMAYIGGAYTCYTMAYEILAQILQLDMEQLYRALWRHPPGRVRANFFDTLDTVMYNTHGKHLDRTRTTAVMSAADIVFAVAAQAGNNPQSIAFSLWKGALQ